ncbi:class I SAM-dependent methyltransferase [Pyxidicoccus xibeiensis]|uniref:class I SAM-dependent methyltransferase n=1 Tax=Pyxidicoccus xibeiensis TaxID=2906759 RepID=UPI0020A7D26B|nr:SAM-dependent methyltransferase [Pyxidicoccus xibeiensis]MCP3140167.1 SAM-dependent methyltransferase [Pyxidicoccus xibeiensis]
MTRARPSGTATKIARFMLLLDSTPRLERVLPSGAAETVEALLRASGAVRRREVDMMRGRTGARLYETAERLLGRGQLLWFGVRKRWMHEAVEQALAEGARQVLVVGAGFDPLAVSVARRHPDVTCVEVDAPATAEPKRAGIQGAGLARPNHVVLAADLASKSLEEVLRPTGWRADVRSVVVAEGLLMYLAPAQVTAFLAQVRACTGPGSRLAFSSMEVDEEGQPRVVFAGRLLGRLIRFSLRLTGEPLRWGIAPAAAPAFLSGAGYRVLDQPTPRGLRERFLSPIGLDEEPLAPYEHLVLAEVSASER